MQRPTNIHAALNLLCKALDAQFQGDISTSYHLGLAEKGPELYYVVALKTGSRLHDYTSPAFSEGHIVTHDATIGEKIPSEFITLGIDREKLMYTWK